MNLEDLSDWRVRIDAIDEEILQLLQKRVECALAVGEIKTANGLPLTDPARERAIYEKLSARQKAIGGTLPTSSITAIFREIISACRNAEHPFKVAFLGPLGTNTSEAAIQFFGSAVEGLSCSSPEDACQLVATGAADFAVVAIENSIHGVVSANLDLLANLSLTVCAEVEFAVHHCLLSNGSLANVKQVYSHEQALAQCRRWLAAQVPNATLVPVSSTARGAAMAAQDPESAAISSALAADMYNVGILARNIEDIPGNKTRFFVVGAADKAPKSSGRDKTSLTFLIPHRAGALHEALGVFSRNNVNLMMIQNRPLRNQNWEYRFFADVQGHQEDANLIAAMEELRDMTVSVKVIGSYPEAG